MRRAFGVLVLLACAACEPVPNYYGPRPALFPAPHPYRGPSVEGSDARELVGCYRAAFQKAREWGPDSTWYFRLDSLAPDSSRPGGGRSVPGARLARASIEDGFEGVYWRRIPNGIQMHIGDTLHGMYVDFLFHRDGLVGRAFGYSDVRFDHAVEMVSARRIPCPEGDWPPPRPPRRPVPGASIGNDDGAPRPRPGRPVCVEQPASSVRGSASSSS